MAGSLYKTMRGKSVDLNRLFNQNELATPVSLGAAKGTTNKVASIPAEYAVSTSSHVPAQNRKPQVEQVSQPVVQQPTVSKPVVPEPVITASSQLSITEVEDTHTKKSKKTEPEAV